MGYQPIENYGIVGNMHTVAFVGINGSIDWLCLPQFDSPSVFAGVLDDQKGGAFKICPTKQDITQKQFYWPDTNVLVTRFLSSEGVAEITDFMPVGGGRAGDQQRRSLIRSVHVDRGSMTFRLECRPAFNYARDEHEVELIDQGICFQSKTLSLCLTSRVALKRIDQGVAAEFTLHEGQTATFELQGLPAGEVCANPLSEEEETQLQANS